MQTQSFTAPNGVLPYYFIQDHRNYAEGDVAGLKVATGDALAETFMDTEKAGVGRSKTAICRRATSLDLAKWAARGKKRVAKAEPLVPVEFETSVGSYRGPMADRPADIAGFPPNIADQYCKGYLLNGKMVGKVAHYYIAPKDIDTELDPDFQKPRKTAKTKSKRGKAALAKSPRTTAIE